MSAQTFTDKTLNGQKRTWTTVGYDGKEYKVRVVIDKDDNELLIAGDELLNAVHPGEWESENDGFASKEAERVYDEIFFFTDDTTLYYSDVDLRQDMAQENPEWFEETGEE